MQEYEKILKVENIEKSFGQNKILKGLTFSIFKNSINVFIGENGAGKTTTINIITNNDKNFGGKILFKNQDINSLRENKIWKCRNIGVWLN